MTLTELTQLNLLRLRIWGDMVEVLLWKRTLREGMNDFTALGSKVVNA